MYLILYDQELYMVYQSTANMHECTNTTIYMYISIQYSSLFMLHGIHLFILLQYLYILLTNVISIFCQDNI